MERMSKCGGGVVYRDGLAWVPITLQKVSEDCGCCKNTACAMTKKLGQTGIIADSLYIYSIFGGTVLIFSVFLYRKFKPSLLYFKSEAFSEFKQAL
jgi:hypothetical protein